ncbi:hypothetical protein [Pyruvatibacter sp.]|uniref:hypothetical protein n=1 Tax=Pyruvatibacter sp. TaxID=1981328 RepID=UPI0032EDF358
MRRASAGIWIWGTAVALAVVFTAWYHNWRGPLTAAQVEAYTEQLAARTDITPQNLQAIRTFMQDDDGKEFWMLNVIKLHDSAQPHPETGEPTDPADLLTVYSSAFIGRLLLSAGHPVFVADKTGPYVDTFGTSATPQWHFVSMVRYRSRRDLMEAATYEGFPGVHLYKTAAMQRTFNFPTQARLSTFAGPAYAVPFLILFAAALTHLVVMIRRTRRATPTEQNR